MFKIRSGNNGCRWPGIKNWSMWCRKSFQTQMCGMLLESTLTAARLPEAVSTRLRKQFTGKIFDQAELTLAVEDGRALAAELAGGRVVSGGRVERMFDTRDQLQAACDDMLGAPREKGTEQLCPARLSGIREMYLMLTGDDDLHGGYHPDACAWQPPLISPAWSRTR